MLTARRLLGLCAAYPVLAALCLAAVQVTPSAAQSAPMASEPTIKAAASHRMSDAKIVRDLRAEMDVLAAEDRFSGAVLFSKDGRPLFEHTYGFANHAFSAANKIDTKFNMASITKVLTAVAILQLAEQGKISLDETLAMALPNYPHQDAASKITIHELLGHKSGLGDFFGKEYEESNPAQYQTIRDYLPLFASKPLLFEPGTKTSYSNAGFIVLGLVIEQLSGTSYYDYVHEHIFRPASMTNTGFWSYQVDVPNLALGYTRLSPGESPGGKQPSANTPRSVTINLTRSVSAGSSFASLEDLLRFSEALRTHKLLGPESVELILSGGYGLGTKTVNGIRSMRHAGGLPGASTYLEMYPDQGYAVVVLSNFDPPTAEIVAQRLRQEIVGAEPLKAVHLPVEELTKFVGTYTAAMHGGGQVMRSPDTPPAAGAGRILLPGPADGKPIQDRPIEIAADREGLWVTLGTGDEHKFVPLSATEFFDRDTLSSARLIFLKDEKGKVSGLTINGGSDSIQSITAAKLP
jgi:CubicO group peptidase (beta-lactamase class C family)